MKKPDLVLCLVISLIATVTGAQEVVVKTFDPELTRAYWTPVALASARPMPLVQLDEESLASIEVVHRDDAEQASVEAPFEELYPTSAEAPSLHGKERFRFRTRLFDYSREELRELRGVNEDHGGGVLRTKDEGRLFPIDYTSSRLIPSEVNTVFPYSTVGKLFGTDNGRDFVCSGAVIAQRLVITAGHCVHGGPTKGMFDNLMFVPAYRDGEAPFGTWEVSVAFVAQSWARSGRVPHAEDYALLQMADQDGSRISEVTGKLAFISKTRFNHIHNFGYPAELDGGEEMHQVTSGSWNTAVIANGVAIMYGSDMGGGASGGPWIQNFNRKSSGQGGGENRARLAVVGVNSFKEASSSFRLNGASELKRDFKVLRQNACRAQAGNC